MINRFKLLLEQLHLTPAGFADKIGVQRSSISHVMSGRNKPSIDFLEKILNVFPDIDTTWLITGRVSEIKTVKQDEIRAENDGTQAENRLFLMPENKKIPDPVDEEPVEHIIIVYKNGTFRMLKHFDR